MELEEMRNAWTEMSSQIENQKKLTDKLIITMTQEQYKNRLGKISTPEVVSTFISVAMALAVLINFKKYDTAYLVTCGIATSLILLVLPFLSLRAIHKLSSLNIGHGNYKQVLTEYTVRKRKLLNVQKLSFYLGFVLLVTGLPVMVKIMGARDIPATTWFWFLPFGFLFFVVFASWVYKGYVKALMQAENLLKELEE
jgi:hypothetical protein